MLPGGLPGPWVAAVGLHSISADLLTSLVSNAARGFARTIGCCCCASGSAPFGWLGERGTPRGRPLLLVPEGPVGLLYLGMSTTVRKDTRSATGLWHGKQALNAAKSPACSFSSFFFWVKSKFSRFVGWWSVQKDYTCHMSHVCDFAQLSFMVLFTASVLDTWPAATSDCNDGRSLQQKHFHTTWTSQTHNPHTAISTLHLCISPHPFRCHSILKRSLFFWPSPTQYDIAL